MPDPWPLTHASILVDNSRSISSNLNDCRMNKRTSELAGAATTWDAATGSAVRAVAQSFLPSRALRSRGFFRRGAEECFVHCPAQKQVTCALKLGRSRKLTMDGPGCHFGGMRL